MRSTFTNQFETPAMVIDAVVAISATFLAAVFILAVVLPPVASSLIG
jgi:hypothetical protein